MIVNLGTREGYNLACALRGPDAERGTDFTGCLKSVFTAPLRLYAGVSELGAEVHELHITNLMDLRDCLTAEAQPSGIAHYMAHVVAGFTALGAWDADSTVCRLHIMAKAIYDLVAYGSEYHLAKTIDIINQTIDALAKDQS
jgi:hypothetical protein